MTPQWRVCTYICSGIGCFVVLALTGWLPFLWLGTVLAMAAGGAFIRWRDEHERRDRT